MDARILKTRQKVLAAATELMIEGGSAAVTVEAIVERSGVAKSTIYRHWDSRDTLLYDVIDQNIPEAWEPPAGLGFADALRALMVHHVTFMGDPQWPSTFLAMVGLKATEPGVAKLVDADRAENLRGFEEVLRRGVASGWRVTDMTPTELVMALIGPLVMATLFDETDNMSIQAERLVERFLASVEPLN